MCPSRALPRYKYFRSSPLLCRPIWSAHLSRVPPAPEGSHSLDPASQCPMFCPVAQPVTSTSRNRQWPRPVSCRFRLLSASLSLTSLAAHSATGLPAPIATFAKQSPSRIFPPTRDIDDAVLSLCWAHKVKAQRARADLAFFAHACFRCSLSPFPLIASTSTSYDSAPTRRRHESFHRDNAR
jgi:hypothetical protein